MLKHLLKYKTKILILAGVLLVIFVFMNSRSGNAQDTEVSESKTQVSLINLQEYRQSYEGVVSSGEVESLGQVQLKSEVMGKVARVNVEIGDEVKKGQTLVVFSNADLVASRNQAAAGYQQALAAKENIEAQYQAQQATFEKIKITGQNSIAAAEANLRTAENNLKLNQTSEDSEIVKQEYDKMVVLLGSIQNTLSSALISADNILGIDNNLANDDFENILSALNYSVLSGAKVSYNQAKTAKISFDTKNKMIGIESSYSEIDTVKEIAGETLSTFSSLLVDVASVLDNTAPIGNLSQAELDALKNSISVSRTSIASSYTSFTAQSQAIQNAKTSLTSFEIAYQKAVRDLADVKAQVAADIETSQAQLNQLAASIKSQNASISSSAASIAYANAQVGKTVITAPIGGKVASLVAKVGEFIGNGQDVVSIVNTDGLKVKTFIDSSEIADVLVGSDVVVEDSYKGTVSNVAPSVDVNTKKVEVVIVIDEEDKDNLVVGEFVDLKILPSQEQLEQNSSIFLPLEAVKINAQGKFVYTIDDQDKIVFVPVEINRIIGNKVEIISGLDDVTDILSSIGNVEEGETVEITN